MNDILEVMIPSETVRKYVLETGWTFTDKEKATLMYMRYNDLPLQELHTCLRDLGDKTADEGLREQITAFLKSEERAIQAFKGNLDGRCIYILQIKKNDDYWDTNYRTCGYFSAWNTALECGKRAESTFKIEKYVVDGVEEFDENTCCHDSIATLRFNKDGELTGVHSSEIPCYEQDEPDFADLYFEIPNPFEQGDIIKSICRGKYGIVDTTQRQWKHSVAKYTEMPGADYLDVHIGVIWFDEKEGTFDLGYNINPLDLELYLPKDMDAGEHGLMDRLLMCASLVDRGQSSLDELYSLTMEYRKMREKANKDKLTEKGILNVLGKGHWMVFDEIYAKVKDSCNCDWSEFVSQVDHLIELGRIQSFILLQSGVPHRRDSDTIFLCGLDE